MLEDDQKFEELESKLAALSSQVEDLEQETEVDPFFEDDVRRVIDDFKSRELAGLESEDEDFDDDEDSSSDDFISVQTTGGPTFKTHWIAPTSCDNMTRDLARDAFVQGAADRYGTSQQVNNGDVLILLCREAVAEEPEEPEPPKRTCKYVGLAYNTLVHPASAEPPSETEESISAPVGNYEIFVWSSCECSNEPAETVVLPSIFEESTGSTSNGNYASIGAAESPDMSNADGLLTEASLRKSEDTSSSNLAKGLSNTLSKNDAGYKAQLVQLSQDLSRYHLDQKKNQLNFEADKKNLNSHGFGSDLFVSKNLELSNGECGNLETVSISGETFDLALLKEGTPSLGSTFLSTAKISLGTAVSIAGTFNLDVYDTNPVSLESDLELVTGSTVFLPVIAENMADKIANDDTLDTQVFSLTGATVTSDSSGVTVSIGTSASTVTANYSSGLLTHKDSTTTNSGSINFNIPSVEVSISDLVDLTNTAEISPYPITSLSNVRADSGTYSVSLYNIPLLANLSKVRSDFAGGLYQGSTAIEGLDGVSLGSINIPSGTTDDGVPSSSDLNISASKSPASGGGVDVSLGLAWTGNSSEYDHGLFKGNTAEENLSASDSFNIKFNDLATPGILGSAGSYIKELQDLEGSGAYNSSGGLDLSLEFTSLKSQLNFIDKGFFNNETTVSNGSGSWSVSISPMTIDTFPDLGEERPSDRIVTNISGISSTLDGSHAVANESKLNLTGNLGVLDYTFNKGLLTGVSLGSIPNHTLGSIIVPTSTSSGDSDYVPAGVSVDYTPDLFKTTVSIGTASTFYQKNIDTFSSGDALIDFDKGLALSLYNPSYTAAGSLSIDASNYNTTHTERVIASIDIRSDYAVVYSSEELGEAKYYIDYTYKDITTTVQNGLVTSITETDLPTETQGPIIVPATPLKYSCDDTLGCQPDPLGEFDEPTCGPTCGDSSSTTPLLTFRPPKIYEYVKSGVYNDVYTLHGTWTKTDPSGISSQGYVDGSGNTDVLQVTVILDGLSCPHLASKVACVNDDSPDRSGHVYLSYQKS